MELGKNSLLASNIPTETYQYIHTTAISWVCTRGVQYTSTVCSLLPITFQTPICSKDIFGHSGHTEVDSTMGRGISITTLPDDFQGWRRRLNIGGARKKHFPSATLIIRVMKSTEVQNLRRIHGNWLRLLS